MDPIGIWRLGYPCPACGQIHNFVASDEATSDELYHFDCPFLQRRTQLGMEDFLTAHSEPLQIVECPNPECKTRVYAKVSGECPSCRKPFRQWSS